MRILYADNQILSLPNDEIISVEADTSNTGLPVLFIHMNWVADTLEEQENKLNIVTTPSRKEAEKQGYLIEDDGNLDCYELIIWGETEEECFKLIYKE